MQIDPTWQHFRPVLSTSELFHLHLNRHLTRSYPLAYFHCNITSHEEIIEEKIHHVLDTQFFIFARSGVIWRASVIVRTLDSFCNEVQQNNFEVLWLWQLRHLNIPQIGFNKLKREEFRMSWVWDTTGLEGRQLIWNIIGRDVSARCYQCYNPCS